MANQKRAAKAKYKKKSQPKVRPSVFEELTDDLADLAQLPGGPIAVADGGTIQAQAARLGDRRLQGAQRRALATQIGRVQGNRHLQRVIASMKGEAKTVPYPSHTSKSPTGSASGTVMKKSANGLRETQAARFGAERPYSVGRRYLLHNWGQQNLEAWKMDLFSNLPTTHSARGLSSSYQRRALATQIERVQDNQHFQMAVRPSAPALSVVQRSPDNDKPPVLEVSPSTSVTRGTTVTLTAKYKEAKDKKAKAKKPNITSWKFTSSAGEVVNRPKSGAKKTQWASSLVLPGKVEVGYSMKSKSGSEVAGTLEQNLQVTPRTGAPWASALGTVEKPDATDHKAPAKPKAYDQLGGHTPTATFQANPVTIPSGPNKNFVYVHLTKTTYKSQPAIHPSLKDPTSEFYKFHQHGRLLYVVDPSSKSKKLVPTNEYTNFTHKPLNFSMTTLTWEAFYKKYGILQVIATAPGKDPFIFGEDCWELASNKKGAKAKLTPACKAAATSALKPKKGTKVTFGQKRVKGYVGYKLIKSVDLLHGTKRHEYVGNVHSHRANFLAMLEILDPPPNIEKMVSTPGHQVDLGKEIGEMHNQIKFAGQTHKIIDKTASRKAQKFVPSGGVEMYDVNDDDLGNWLGDAWDIDGGKRFLPHY